MRVERKRKIVENKRWKTEKWKKKKKDEHSIEIGKAGSKHMRKSRKKSVNEYVKKKSWSLFSVLQ